MRSRMAAIVVVAYVKSHYAAQSGMVVPMGAAAMRVRLAKAGGMDEERAGAVLRAAVEELAPIVQPEGGDEDGFLARLTEGVGKAVRARMPDADPLSAYLKAVAIDGDALAGLGMDLFMEEDGVDARIAMERAEARGGTPGVAVATAEVAIGPKRDEYVPLKRELLSVKSMRGLNLQVERASGGQIATGEMMFERLVQQDETISNLREALLGASAGERAAEKGESVVPTYRFQSRVVDVKAAFPVKRIVGTTEMSASAACQLQVTRWSCEPPHPNVPEVDEEYRFDAASLATAAYAIEAGKNFALVGPTGSGKTTFLEQLAARLGRPFYRIPIDGEMRRKEIIGGFKQQVFENGSATVWFDGLLTEAIRYPSVIDLDEFDRGDPDLLYAAHQALERKGILILEDSGRYVRMHPSCAVGATANTKGRADGNGVYANVTELSEASRDRFPFWIDHDYLAEEAELALVEAQNPTLSRDMLKRLTEVAVDMRVAFKGGRIRTACSTRQVKETAAFASGMLQIMKEGEALRYAMSKVLVARGCDDADAKAIRELVNQRLPGKKA